jgi:hypothetical protein
MKAIVRQLTDETVFRRACEMTLQPGQKSRVSLARMLDAEHSPIRTIMFWVELHDLPSFVSVHLVRHKIGVEHFVQSRRDDRSGDAPEAVTRLTPVNHGLLINAQALITMSRKRLCLHAHRSTVAAWMRVRRAMQTVNPSVAAAMVPECSYRGRCPELRECGPGAEKVMAAYGRASK